MNNRHRARIAVARGGAIKDVSERYKISVNTLKSWLRRGKAKNANAPLVAPLVGQKLTWMRSIHHDWAHLVDEVGRPACSATPAPMSFWHPAEETKRCTRCQGFENKNKI